jgi:hypothetical protein
MDAPSAAASARLEGAGAAMDRARAARAAEVAVVGALLALAAWLRVVHLGTPSLWWDELVHVRTADRALADVLTLVRQGLGYGVGNAGAMPADYVLLHGWLRAVPRPAPEHLETYFRTPACAASIAAVGALYLLGRAAFGRATGALAALLLATSLPAVLYAAEARSYSLLTLASVLDVAAFAGVAAAPGRLGRWVLYLAASAFYFLTGVFGLLVIGVQYAVLATLALRGRPTAPRLWLVAASAALFAVVAGPYLAGTPWRVTYPRSAVLEPLGVTSESIRFLAGSPALVAAFLVALPFAILAGVRRRRGAVAWSVVLAFATLPAIALILRWKHYYFHGRHVLFLLPLLHLVVAAGAVELVRRADPLRRLVRGTRVRRTIEAAALGLLVLALVAPDLRAFVAGPRAWFARSKTLRDLREVTRDVAVHVATLEPGARHLVLAERESTANAVLSAYLDWWGVADRVTLRSPGVPLAEVMPALRAHGGDPTALAIRPAVGLYFGLRELLRLGQPIGDVPARVTDVTIVGYGTPQAGPDVRRYTNVTVRVAAR